MRTAVPNDYAAYNEVDIDPERMWGISDLALLLEHARRWARLSHQHLVLQYNCRTRDGRPRRISDFLDRAAFRRTRGSTSTSTRRSGSSRRSPSR